jgi:hypothetical protein
MAVLFLEDDPFLPDGCLGLLSHVVRCVKGVPVATRKREDFRMSVELGWQRQNLVEVTSKDDSSRRKKFISGRGRAFH